MEGGGGESRGWALGGFCEEEEEVPLDIREREQERERERETEGEEWVGTLAFLDNAVLKGTRSEEKRRDETRG